MKNEENGEISLRQKIVSDYKETNTIQRVAKVNSVSLVKVRRILISEGLWSSPLSDKIKPLWESGMSTKEISRMLNVSIKTVQAYAPYSRGTYGEKASGDAKRSAAYRQRCKNALNTQVLHGYNNFMEDSLPLEIRKRNICLYSRLSDGPEKAIKLKLELIGSEVKEHPELKKFGRAKRSISRTVLIPGSMTFHAFHFLLQRAFGWANRKEHHFALEWDYFMWLTNDYFKKYMEMCGIYFRFPGRHLDDLHWEDDYQGDKSILTWFKDKYCGPYYYLGYQDHYIENVLEIRKFNAGYKDEIVNTPLMYDNNRLIARKVRFIPEKSTINDNVSLVNFPRSLNCLCERLPIREVLTAKSKLPKNPREAAERSVKEGLEYQENPEMIKCILNVEQYRAQMMAREHPLIDADETWKYYQKTVAKMTPKTVPITDTVLYYYDSNDKWCVRVTCEEVYYEGGSGYVDAEGARVNEQLETLIHDFSMHEVPVCLEMDGLPVMDNVDGVQGYCDFLKNLKGTANEVDRETCKEWAKRQGWSGRKSHSKYLL